MCASALDPVVFVTDIRFWQNTYGSHMRIRRLVRLIQGLRPVQVFCLMPLTDADAAMIAREGLSDITFIDYQTWARPDRKVKWALGHQTFFAKLRNMSFAGALAAYLAEIRAHSVVLEYIKLGYLHDACPKTVPVILDLHDIMSARSVALQGAGLKASIEIDPDQERLILSRMAHVLAISTTDAAILTDRMRLGNVIYAPYSVDVVPSDFAQRDRRRLLFVGARSQPNIVGLTWLLDQVMPVLARLGFVLDVVGTICDALPGRQDAGVVWHGQQDDLTPFLMRAGISVNPVFVGGGLKIKCLDSLAHGVPVVTTDEGAAGLTEALGAGLYIARSRREFIDTVLRLGRDDQERRIASRLAQHAVGAGFSDQAVAQMLHPVFGPQPAAEAAHA